MSDNYPTEIILLCKFPYNVWTTTAIEDKELIKDLTIFVDEYNTEEEKR